MGDLENGSQEPECNGLKTAGDDYTETVKWTATSVFDFEADLVSKAHATKEYNIEK